MDSIWLKLAVAVVLAAMLFQLYPAAKHWAKNGPKAQQGDWGKVLFPLALVIGFVVLLIMLVR